MIEDEIALEPRTQRCVSWIGGQKKTLLSRKQEGHITLDRCFRPPAACNTLCLPKKFEYCTVDEDH